MTDQLSFDDVRGRHHAEDLPTGFDPEAMARWRVYFENVARTRYGADWWDRFRSGIGYDLLALQPRESRRGIRTTIIVPEPVPPRMVCGNVCERILDGGPSCSQCGAYPGDAPEPDWSPFDTTGHLDLPRLEAEGFVVLGALSDDGGMIV